MIFNPYDLHFLGNETAPAASMLSSAQPLLQDNAVLVGLILGFLVVDMLSVRPKGVMRYQCSWLTDTRSARTFESTAVIYPWIKPLLLLQSFFFFGLALFVLLTPDAGQQLLHPTYETWSNLALCEITLLGWYLLQSGFVNWFCYLFDFREKRIIANRSHTAVFAVLAPISMLIYIAQMSGMIPSGTTVILLATLFILSQICFIFNGIKIFYEGLGSLLLIFVYLCTLEIAPLWVIWAKITTQQV